MQHKLLVNGVQYGVFLSGLTIPKADWYVLKPCAHLSMTELTMESTAS